MGRGPAAGRRVVAGSAEGQGRCCEGRGGGGDPAPGATASWHGPDLEVCFPGWGPVLPCRRAPVAVLHGASRVSTYFLAQGLASQLTHWCSGRCWVSCLLCGCCTSKGRAHCKQASSPSSNPGLPPPPLVGAPPTPPPPPNPVSVHSHYILGSGLQGGPITHAPDPCSSSTALLPSMVNQEEIAGSPLPSPAWKLPLCMVPSFLPGS